MIAVVTVLAFGNQVDDLPDEVNYGCGRDPDLRSDVWIEAPRCSANILAGNRVPQTLLPQNCAFGIIGIEGINRVVFRGYKEYIALRARNGEIGDVQGLSVDVPVHRQGEELAKIADVDVGSVEPGLLAVFASAIIVVMLGGDRYLGRCTGRDQQNTCRQNVEQIHAHGTGRELFPANQI